MLLAFAAVIVPVFENAGLSCGILATFKSPGPSSVSTTTSLPLTFTVTGTISSLNSPCGTVRYDLRSYLHPFSVEQVPAVVCHFAQFYDMLLITCGGGTGGWGGCRRNI